MGDYKKMIRTALTDQPTTLLWWINSIYSEYVERNYSHDKKPSTFYSSHFVQQTTQFDTFDEFHHQSPWKMQTWKEIQQIPNTALNSYVTETTQFDFWKDMKARAAIRNLLDHYTV